MEPTRNLVVSVTLNPCVDTVLFLDGLTIGDRNEVIKKEQDAGGKGVNLARVLHKLGSRVIATGFIGGVAGSIIKSVLNAEGVEHDFISLTADTRTSWLIETGQHAPTTIVERGPCVTEQEFSSFKQELDLLCVDAEWVCFGGSLPRGLPDDSYVDLINQAHARGCKVSLDADGEFLRHGLTACPDLIKPNLHEAERYLGRKLTCPTDALAAAEEIRSLLRRGRDRTGYDPIVIISLGKEGAVLSSSKGQLKGESPSVHARSTIGSGDSMLAAFLWALQQRKSPKECLRWGLAAGAATAITNGAEIASKLIINQLLDRSQACGGTCAACKAKSEALRLAQTSA